MKGIEMTTNDDAAAQQFGAHIAQQRARKRSLALTARDPKAVKSDRLARDLLGLPQVYNEDGTAIETEGDDQ